MSGTREIRNLYAEWKREEVARREQSERLKAIFAAAKDMRLNPKALRVAFKERYALDTSSQEELEKRNENSEQVDEYLSALSGASHACVREGHEILTPNASISGDGKAVSDDLVLTPAHEPQPSLMAGKAAASIPPEVAAKTDTPETATRSDQTSKSTAVHTDAGNTGVTAGETAPNHQSSDLHDGRLQAVPAPALDESRDSAAGVEAPAAPVTYPAPGVVTYEGCPPEPVRWHEYAECFPWTSVDARDGIDEPIVKMGNIILDGRARYDAARSIGIEYPVAQYAGTDPLADVIRWNLESRDMPEKDKRAVASRLAMLVPDRADEIMDMFGLEVAEATA